MNLTRDRIHSIGWASILLMCLVLTVAVTLRVNAVKSQVHDVDKQILGVRRNIAFLETEFQTRANQQQLKLLNEVEFGYTAPSAGQYIEGERQLAAYGRPAAPGAPAPILYAHDDGTSAGDGDRSLLAMVSPLAGKAVAATLSDQDAADDDDEAGRSQAAPRARPQRSLIDRLTKVTLAEASAQ